VPEAITGALCAFLLLAADARHGIHLYQQRRFQEAAQAFRDLLKNQPGNAEARVYLARTLIELEDVAEGLRELERVLKDGAGPEAKFQAGRVIRELAERRLADLQRLAPDSAALRELAGIHYERKGQHEKALEEFRQAAVMEPRRPGIHYRIGNVLWRMRELEQAEQHLRRELTANPHHAQANLRLGQVLVARNQEEQAAPLLERAVKGAPGSIEARRELGKAYRKLGRLKEARQLWEAIAAARPEDDQVHYLLGGLYREMGEAELARTAFDKHRSILDRRRELAEKR
jgi:tetratricopeptide (TPR) repeat protein